MTPTEIKIMVNEAKLAAANAAKEYYVNRMGGRDAMPCGFAWTSVYKFNGQKIRGNSKIGKALKEAGVNQNYHDRTFQIWNPSGLPLQNVDAKEVGARAAAKVFEKYGFESYAGSRWD